MNHSQALPKEKRPPNQLNRQQMLLLPVEGTRMAYPSCNTPVSALDAAGVDADGYDFGQALHRYQCPVCGAPLVQIVPPISSGHPLWRWQLEHSWLQQQLRKARAFDHLLQPKANGTIP